MFRLRSPALFCWRCRLVSGGEHGLEQRLALRCTFFAQIDGLGLSNRVADQNLLVKALQCRAVKAFPSCVVLVVNAKPKQGEYDLVDAIGVDARRRHVGRGHKT
jgi:hypothetical protein